MQWLTNIESPYKRKVFKIVKNKLEYIMLQK